MEIWHEEHVLPVGSDNFRAMSFHGMHANNPDSLGQIGKLVNNLKLDWLQFEELMIDCVFPLVFEKLKTDINEQLRRYDLDRHDQLMLEKDDFEIIQDELVTRRNKHILAPHIDNLRGALTILYYMPPDSDHMHLGTLFYKQVGSGRPLLPKDMPVPFYAQYASSFDITCVEAKRVPFAPNTLIAFVNSIDAWHGQHLDELYDRRGYQSFFGVREALLDRIFDAKSVRSLTCGGAADAT
ncbi:hypothetical protein [Azospirillum griseum]|uniref:Uncharacterized protein n=1 Tax=Azospirillum griseum TaxID=2496639 RepID=A0A431VE35_9PROT|nr:hypothetical protein [Azospirillum griseum]RTR17589.1 hypothetical protein EJ903_17435 [Azospirillum griseum]